MTISPLLEIKDEWCREMAEQAIHDAEETGERITIARGKRSSCQKFHFHLA
jgi:hypothetical protein